ncbi:MAG: anaerobic ribonucleoside-triphosphate reductase activating protein [Spirochaetes bacterium]|nr:anaerobic ribonucleoside-triphosphate reductase activating protein [Spirochaetota bacterium]
MNIRGIQKTSLIDYPQVISTVLFTGGCNLQCLYCHNPSLACNDCNLNQYSNNEVLELLQKRKNLIGGVVLTGGEPTLGKGIVPFLENVKEIGLKVKLDTNGFQPKVLQKLASRKLLDYVAIDIKTSPEKYPSLTKTKLPFDLILESIALLKEYNIVFELRTTCVPGYVTLEDFHSIKERIGKVLYYYLQQFHNHNTLDATLKKVLPYPAEILHSFRAFVQTFATICEIRGI